MSVLQVVESDQHVIARLSGKIDGINSGEIQEEALKLLELDPDAEDFTFDMNEVTYVSSAGLRMFSAVARACKDLSIPYTLNGLRDHIVRMFQLTGYSSSITIIPREEA